jgi:hypothetical protein
MMPVLILDRVPSLPDNRRIIFAGEETMPNKSAVTFLFVFLAIIPAYAALPEQPNSVPSDPNSLQKLINDANKGDPNARFNLGRMYFKGNGVSQDYNQAVKWYTTAAEQGNACAQCHLGGMYFNGKGVIKDYVEAYKWAVLADINNECTTKIKKNLTPAQIAEAQKRANEFAAKKEKVTPHVPVGDAQR